ncbi:hypothetical protein PJK45_24220 [Mycobacterium kansasii]
MPAQKNLIGIRWRVVSALQDDGWILRSLAECKPEGVVLEPCRGGGAIGVAPQRSGRRDVGIDSGASYLELSLNHPRQLRDAAIDVEARA